MPRWYGHAVDTLSTLMTTSGPRPGARPVSGLIGRVTVRVARSGATDGSGSGAAEEGLGLGAGGAALGGGTEEEPHAVARTAMAIRERRSTSTTVGAVRPGMGRDAHIRPERS